MASHVMADADPEVGIPELVRRLTDDSRRLVGDEVRLAKLEFGQAVQTGTRGSIWLAIAFGAAVVALTALTVLLIVLFGRLLDNLWAGALVTGALEVLAGFLMLRYGLARFREPSDAYTLGATRAEIAETARWVRHPAT